MLLPIARCTDASQGVIDDEQTNTHEPIAKQYQASEDGVGDYSIVVNQVQRKNNETLLWGPYRPQVYFGIKPRLPDSFIGGLMWTNVNEFRGMQNNFRHTCEQNDELEGYGWEEYDVRTGGNQVVRDKGNHIDLQMELRKVEGGNHGKET